MSPPASSRPRTRLAGLVAGAVVLVLLAGCSGGSSGAGTGPVASGRGASPLPGPLLSQPAVPGTTDAERVAAAARAYYATVSAAANTGDLAGLAAASVESCPCRSVLEFLRELYGRGQRLDRFGYQVGAVGVPTVAGSRGTVTVTYRQAGYRLLGADGATVTQYPAESEVTALVSLDLVEGRWLVAGIEGA